MTRESEKSKIRMSVIVDGKHINSLKKAVKAVEVIDQIFYYFGEQLQDKDDEIELLKHRVEEAMKLKTCDGCKFKNNVKFVQVVDETLDCCYVCVRQCYDYFEPKDNE